MTQRYRERLEKGLAKYGRQGIVKAVTASTGRKKRAVERWLKDGPSNSHGAYNIALACGANEEEAIAVARECFPMEAEKAG